MVTDIKHQFDSLIVLLKTFPHNSKGLLWNIFEPPFYRFDLLYGISHFPTSICLSLLQDPGAPAAGTYSVSIISKCVWEMTGLELTNALTVAPFYTANQQRWTQKRRVHTTLNLIEVIGLCNCSDCHLPFSAEVSGWKREKRGPRVCPCLPLRSAGRYLKVFQKNALLSLKTKEVLN